MDQPMQKKSSESPAEIYEHHMVPAIFAPWVSAVVGLAAPQPGESVLDIACGTGVIARDMASQVGSRGRVVGLDINPNMLDMARIREPAVEWKEGSALAMPFADSEFDAVVCQQGLQFFPDRGVALREMHRVLVPGGRLALALWCEIESSSAHHALAQGLERHVGSETAALMYAVFRLGDAETIHTLLAEAGFCDVRIRREKRMAHFLSPEAFTRFVVVGSVLGRTGVQVRDETLTALITDVNEVLKPYVQSDGFAFSMEAHLAAAHT